MRPFLSDGSAWQAETLFPSASYISEDISALALPRKMLSALWAESWRIDFPPNGPDRFLMRTRGV